MCWPISFSRLDERPALSVRNSSTDLISEPLYLVPATVLLRSVFVVVAVFHADGVVGSRKRHLAHRRGLHRQRRQILGLQRMDVGLAASTRQELRFHRQRVQEIVDALRRFIGIEALAQQRILRRHADRTAAGVAVVAVTGFDTDFIRIVGDAFDVFVAVERHQYRVADGDGVSAERHRLGDVAAVADAAGIDQRYLVPLAELVDGAPRLADGGDTGNAGVLGGNMGTGAGAAFHRIDVDRVGTALYSHAHVVIDARRTELKLDRDLVIGGFADLFDLERQIVRSEPVRVPGRRALVDAGRQRAHFGDLVRHLLAHEVAAETDLAALADEEFASIGDPQMMRIEPVARLDALIEPAFRIAPLVGDHSAFTGAW